MATTADFRNGLCIEYNNDLYTIVEFQHVKPGKGGAFVRTKLKNLKTGKVIDNTFNAGVKVNVARIERHPYQYLYKDDMGIHFMHNETFEQTSFDPAIVQSPELLKENQNVEVVIHADSDTALAVELPAFVEMTVTYTEPGMRGDTASSNVTKPATIETGTTIRVPFFINTGDRIKIDTRTQEYVERVK